VRFPQRAFQDATVSYSTGDVVAVALMSTAVAGWVGLASGSFSFGAWVACEAAFFAFYLAGSLIASWKALARGVLFDLPLRLLLGYAIVNTALLVLALVSPIGMVGNFCIVFGCIVLVLFAMGERKRVSASPASLCVVGICFLATTLWCQDSLDPIENQGNLVLFKPWVDGFYHAVHVRIFAESHGASTIEDFRMAGVPARLYHYGVYMLPALVKQASGIHSYTAFAAILSPVGVFFTGLAAYTFFGSLWGAWPGVAAAAALLLFPDGAQQGLQNQFMSYHWLTQISPSATYGLALLAVAWLFVVQGCTRGSRLQLFAGWLVAGIVVAYKLHYVVASALLLLLVPALFFRARLSKGKRALWALAACSFYAACLFVGQKVPGVPLIRFDGSAVGEVLRLVQSFHLPGAFRDAVTQRMGAEFPWTANLSFGVPYVLFTILGAYLPLLVILVVRSCGNRPLLHLLFPLILIANFLVMFFGLALDFESSTPDELSHRPLMIVYFFVVAWVGGALGSSLLQSRRWSRFAPAAILGFASVLLVVPGMLGPGVQRMWSMPKLSPVLLPSTLVRVAEHMRARGSSEDVFQDSQFDRIYALAALSERRAFVSHTLTRMPFRAEMVATRSAAVDRLMGLGQESLVRGTAQAYGIRWFVLQRGNKVHWPAELAKSPAFQSGSFTVYEF
jgi:hypothetical protein